MNRRAFLHALGFGTVAAAAAATSVLDLERLLWVPGEKTIFIPTVPITFHARLGLPRMAARHEAAVGVLNNRQS
jgi:hypothetical protein